MLHARSSFWERNDSQGKIAMKMARELAIKVLKDDDPTEYISFNLNFVSLAIMYYAHDESQAEPLLGLLNECEALRIKRNNEQGKLFSYSKDEELEIIASRVNVLQLTKQKAEILKYSYAYADVMRKDHTQTYPDQAIFAEIQSLFIKAVA